MNVTQKLLRVYLVDKQLWGLRGRLGGAERFLEEQHKQLGHLTAQRDTVNGQIRQLAAKIGELEVEIKSMDEKVEKLREQMNSAKTNKEYKAFLTEVNTFRAERDKLEEETLGLIAKQDELKAKLGELDSQHGEREKVRGVAEGERQARAEEIKDRVEQLQKERDELASDVPGDAMRTYDQLVTTLGDEVMAPVHIQDRKRHEFTCGACMMTVPVETVSALMSHGSLTRCVSCGCICYLEESTVEALRPASSKR